MKRGDKVRCVNRGISDYLTDGKEYEVTAGAGDTSMFGEIIEEDSEAFEVLNDDSLTIFCCGLLNSSHATWELVE
jgi:hypothetical protein